jgi:hypothetical protein
MVVLMVSTNVVSGNIKDQMNESVSHPPWRAYGPCPLRRRYMVS